SPYEDTDKVWSFGSKDGISIEALKWANNNLDTFKKLCMDEKFITAIESYTGFSHIMNLRMATALIWAGVESLFEIKNEISFRLSAIVSSYLYDRGIERYKFYKEFRKLYS